MFSHYFKNIVPFRYEVEGDAISEEMLFDFIPQLKHVPIKASQKEKTVLRARSMRHSLVKIS